ncbi:putative uncharacterized protein [Lachnospiraceae bacterium CAG:215]|nr:putative uncharacterized protein [Lachnospiraceae bacterium CAG:215]
MAHPLFQTDFFECECRDLFAALLGNTAVDQRQFHIPQRIQIGNQIKALKNETDLLVPDLGKLVVGQTGNVLPIQQITSGSRRIQTAEHVHQRRFPGTGVSDDRHQFAAVDRKADTVERTDFIFAGIVDFVDVFNLY